MGVAAAAHKLIKTHKKSLTLVSVAALILFPRFFEQA
jgi:hypothetical protein